MSSKMKLAALLALAIACGDDAAEMLADALDATADTVRPDDAQAMDTPEDVELDSDEDAHDALSDSGLDILGDAGTVGSVLTVECVRTNTVVQVLTDGFSRWQRRTFEEYVAEVPATDDVVYSAMVCEPLGIENERVFDCNDMVCDREPLNTSPPDCRSEEVRVYGGTARVYCGYDLTFETATAEEGPWTNFGVTQNRWRSVRLAVFE